MTWPRVREDLALLEGYHSAQVDVDIRLNTNEAPGPPPPEFSERLSRAVDEIEWNRYPERGAVELRRRIAALDGVRPDQVFPANGSNEALQTVLLTFGGPGRSALTFEPTYALHSHIARVSGTEVVTGPRRSDFTVDPDAACALIASHAPAVTFLCSPNNPSGTVEPSETVDAVLTAVEANGGLLVVDEAYGQFSPSSSLDLVAENRPILVTRTFSKTWSMAAARLGYAVGSSRLVAELDKIVLPYHLDAVTQRAGLIALDYVDAMNKRVAGIVEERGRLAHALGDLPVRQWRSGANFILFRPDRRDARRSVGGARGAVDPGARLQLVAGPRRVPTGDPGNPRRERPLRHRPPRRTGHVTMSRRAERHRVTNETDITIDIELDGVGDTSISTGLPFFDHMLDQLGRHGGFDLTVAAVGDLDVDGHHTIEDVGILLGEAFAEALGDKTGIRRFASGAFPLDEALIEVALDLSGRPFIAYDVPFGEVLPLGSPPFNPEMAEHFFVSIAEAARFTLHVNRRAGVNTHHVIEATFKGVARCLRDAIRVDGVGVPSTKGTL